MVMNVNRQKSGRKLL